MQWQCGEGHGMFRLVSFLEWGWDWGWRESWVGSERASERAGERYTRGSWLDISFSSPPSSCLVLPKPFFGCLFGCFLLLFFLLFLQPPHPHPTPLFFSTLRPLSTSASLLGLAWASYWTGLRSIGCCSSRGIDMALPCLLASSAWRFRLSGLLLLSCFCGVAAVV